MKRTFMLVVFALVVLTPPAEAFLRVPPETPVPGAPCLHLDLVLPAADWLRSGLFSAPFPFSCDQPIEVSWWANATEGQGSIDLTLSTMSMFSLAPCDKVILWSGPDPCDLAPMSAGRPSMIDTSLRGVLRRWFLGERETVAPEAPSSPHSSAVARFEGGGVLEKSVVVSARFYAKWGFADCASSRGEIVISVDEETVSTQAPAELFTRLCGMSRPDVPGTSHLGPQAAGLVAGVLAEVSHASASLAAAAEPVWLALLALSAPAPVQVPEVEVAEPCEELSLCAILPDAAGVVPPPVGPTVEVPAESAAPPDLAVSGGTLLRLTPGEGKGELANSIEVDGGARASAATAHEIDSARLAPARSAATPAEKTGAASAATSAPPSPALPAPPAVAESGATPDERAIGIRQSTSLDPYRGPPVVPSGEERPFAAAARDPLPGVVVIAQTEGATKLDPEATRLAASAIGASLLILLGFVLYQRFARPAALAEPTRNALYTACVQGTAAASAGELGRAVGIGRKSAEYHLMYLVRLGLLRAELRDGRTRVFASPAMPRAPEPPPISDRVLDLARMQSEIPLSTIMKELDLKWSRADACVKGLVLQGKLTSRWTSDGRLYSLRREA